MALFLNTGTNFSQAALGYKSQAIGSSRRLMASASQRLLLEGQRGAWQ